MERLFNSIQAILENHSEVLVGFRGLEDDEQYKVGDIARDSYEWDIENDCSAYFTTGEQTDGTCAVGGWLSWMDEKEEILEKLNEWKEEANQYGSTSEIAFLIGEAEGDYGTRDPGEVRIQNAEVAAII